MQMQKVLEEGEQDVWLGKVRKFERIGSFDPGVVGLKTPPPPAVILPGYFVIKRAGSSLHWVVQTGRYD